MIVDVAVWRNNQWKRNAFLMHFSRGCTAAMKQAKDIVDFIWLPNERKCPLPPVKTRLKNRQVLSNVQKRTVWRLVEFQLRLFLAGNWTVDRLGWYAILMRAHWTFLKVALAHCVSHLHVKESGVWHRAPNKLNAADSLMAAAVPLRKKRQKAWGYNESLQLMWLLRGVSSKMTKSRSFPHWWK